jgi:DNA-binding NarL/FixJ family response regulator
LTTVALIEDDAVYRRLLEEIARHSKRYRVTGAFESAEAAMPLIVRDPPQIAIVDVNLPGRSGIDVVRQLRERCPDTRCLILTNHADEETIFAALEAGASGYLLKSDPPNEVLEGLDELVAGGSPLSRSTARHILKSFSRPRTADKHPALTGRERQIMDVLARGSTYKEIGKKLGISAATVKNHLYRIYEKLRVRSRTEAVVKWMKR